MKNFPIKWGMGKKRKCKLRLINKSSLNNFMSFVGDLVKF